MKSLGQCLQLVLLVDSLAGVAYAADLATQPPRPARGELKRRLRTSSLRRAAKQLGEG